MNEILDLVKQQSSAFEQTAKRIGDLEKYVSVLDEKAGRPTFGGSQPAEKQPERWFDSKTGAPIRAVKHGQALATSNDGPSFGRLLRGICLGGQAADAAELADERKSMGMSADPSGGYTIGGTQAERWIDNLRANMVLSKAGCITLPMNAGEVSLARVTADPECFWHTENAALTDADPTFGRLKLQAKTIVCLTRVSLELAQDSVNLEEQLGGVISRALANAIDAAGLNGSTTNASAAPSGLMNLSGRNTVTSVGAPTAWDFLADGVFELMNDNVLTDRLAFIAHPRVWKKMIKLKAGITDDETPLVAPAELAAIPKLWTTAAHYDTTCNAIVGNFSDLVFGVRNQINVRVLSESFMGSNLQIALLAYARVDFGALRPQSFCSLEGISV